MSTEFRPYAPEDFNALYAIDQACYPPGIAYSRRALRWFLERPGAECLVAEVAGRVAGFVLAEHEGPYAHLITIDLLEPYRRRGVGTALLRAIEQRLATDGVRLIELETATNNLPAIAFWKKHGYRSVAVHKGYYLDRIDAFSMFKSLTTSQEN